MRAAVFSDTHGNTALMVEAVRRCRPDVVIHLGDYERDVEILKKVFPEIPLANVCGNCDMFPAAPLEQVVQLGPVRALLTHGHRYNVDWGNFDSLVYAAMERGCGIVMFGHTHRAENCEFGGVRIINPGTAGRGRKLTWALVEVFDNGGIAAEIRDL